MTRLRRNLIPGTLGAQLGANATAITFAAVLKTPDGTNVPTLVSPDYYTLILEPDTVNEEIVWLTAYTVGAFTGTVTRSAEPNTGPATLVHANATPWKHGPTAADFSIGTVQTALASSVDFTSQLVGPLLSGTFTPNGTRIRMKVSCCSTNKGKAWGHLEINYGQVAFPVISPHPQYISGGVLPGVTKSMLGGFNPDVTSNVDREFILTELTPGTAFNWTVTAAILSGVDKTYPLPGAWGAVITNSGKKLYVSDKTNSQVAVLIPGGTQGNTYRTNPSTQYDPALKTFIAVGASPQMLDNNADDTKVVVANATTVSIINAVSDTLQGTYTLPGSGQLASTVAIPSKRTVADAVTTGTGTSPTVTSATAGFGALDLGRRLSAGAMIPSTAIALTSDWVMLTGASTTINVVSTTNFPASGSFTVATTSGDQTVITYAGLTGTTFTGCTGGAGVLLTAGATVTANIYVGVVNSATSINLSSSQTANTVWNVPTALVGSAQSLTIDRSDVAFVADFNNSRLHALRLSDGAWNNAITYVGAATSYSAFGTYGLQLGATTTVNQTGALPVATLIVASTAGYPASGSVVLQIGTGFTTVAYTGTTGTTFTGCTGGSGTLGVGQAVTQSLQPVFGCALPNGTEVYIPCYTAVSTAYAMSVATGLLTKLTFAQSNARSYSVCPMPDSSAVWFILPNSMVLQEVVTATHAMGVTSVTLTGNNPTFGAIDPQGWSMWLGYSNGKIEQYWVANPIHQGGGGITSGSTFKGDYFVLADIHPPGTAALTSAINQLCVDRWGFIYIPDANYNRVFTYPGADQIIVPEDGHLGSHLSVVCEDIL